MDIYDPGTAAGSHGFRYYGYDQVIVKYVGVNSCMTMTCIHNEGLWGAHFAFSTADKKEITKEFVGNTLGYLEEGMPSTKAGTVLLIGPTLAWEAVAGESWQQMLTYAKKWGGGRWRQFNTDNLDSIKFGYMNIYLRSNSKWVQIKGVNDHKETGNVHWFEFSTITPKP
jgi:hypothetical protein